MRIIEEWYFAHKPYTSAYQFEWRGGPGPGRNMPEVELSR